MTIRWFSDEDRERMREDERMARLRREFEWEWIMTHYREADRGSSIPRDWAPPHIDPRPRLGEE